VGAAFGPVAGGGGKRSLTAGVTLTQPSRDQWGAVCGQSTTGRAIGWPVALAGEGEHRGHRHDSLVRFGSSPRDTRMAGTLLAVQHPHRGRRNTGYRQPWTWAARAAA
jgi:hypothetical protein